MTPKQMEAELLRLSERWVKYRHKTARDAYRRLHEKWLATKDQGALPLGDR